MLTMMQKTLASVCLYAVAALFVKLSILCLYLRLFKVKTTVRWLIYGGMAACSILYTASVISNMILFVPPPGQPQVSVHRRKKCEKYTNFKPLLFIDSGRLVRESSGYRE